MEFQGSSRIPSEQLQTSQEAQPQRKRPRTPPVSPSRPTPESSTAQDEIQKSTYVSWTDRAQSQLFQWLEEPGNYDKWKCAGVKSSSGSTRTSGLTKKAVTHIISRHLDTLHTKKTPEQIMSKMRYVEKKFKDAEDYLRSTGEGLNSNDEKMGITVIRDKVLSLCPFYYQVKPFMSESVAFNPPYLGETGMNESFQELLFGTSSGYGLHDSIAEEEEGNDNEVQSPSTQEEEPDFETESSAQQDQNHQPTSEGKSFIQSFGYLLDIFRISFTCLLDIKRFGESTSPIVSAKVLPCLSSLTSYDYFPLQNVFLFTFD